jgi:hypothetical protein
MGRTHLILWMLLAYSPIPYAVGDRMDNLWVRIALWSALTVPVVLLAGWAIDKERPQA